MITSLSRTYTKRDMRNKQRKIQTRGKNRIFQDSSLPWVHKSEFARCRPRFPRVLGLPWDGKLRKLIYKQHINSQHMQKLRLTQPHCTVCSSGERINFTPKNMYFQVLNVKYLFSVPTSPDTTKISFFAVIHLP